MAKGDFLFKNAIKKPKKVISIRVDEELSDNFDKLCKKHNIVKAEIYEWALDMAVTKISEKLEGKENVN